MGRRRLLFSAVGNGKGVLDIYFDDIAGEPVRSEEEGWSEISHIPQLWNLMMRHQNKV
jgi:hypothetical protein